MVTNVSCAFCRIVFTPQITEVMRSILNGGTADQSASTAKPVVEQSSTEGQTEGSAPVMSSKFKTGGFKKAFVPVDTANQSQQPAINPATANVEQTSATAEDDLDGEAMDLDDDIDGVAIGDDDIDGVVMGDDDDLDGVALVDYEDGLEV